MLIENKIPPPLVALFFFIIMWLVSSGAPNSISSIRIILIILLILLGIIFSISALASFRNAKTTFNPLKPQSATSLVVSGTYKLSRNPMYLGIAFILLAWSIFLVDPWFLLGVIGFIIYMNQFQIVPEEKAMFSLFGEQYINYSKKVRRWL